MNQTWNSKVLTIMLLFRFLFGGYIAGMDQYLFNDIDSAWTVVTIYVLTGIFFSLYLYGRLSGLKALIGLDAVFFSLNLLYTALSVGRIIDPGLHDPFADVWLTLIQISFSLVTLVYSIKLYRESSSPLNVKS